jgi:hypothetical protein
MHELVVPKSTKGRPAISISKETIPERPKQRVPEWDKEPQLGPDEQEEVLIAFYKESFGFLVPTYDKLSLFLMVVTLILLCSTNIEMRDWIRRDWRQDLTYIIFNESITYRIIFGIVPIFVVVLFSPLSKSRRTIDFKKKVMLVFAVLTNAGTGIIAGMYLLRNTSVFNWLLIFPIWNIINSFLMLAMLRFGVIDEECISDRKATLVQIVLGLIAVLVILVLCNYVFKLYWAITFSICIVYTTSFDRALQNVFPGLTHRGDEQTEQPR